jgi:hypothetical protein
MSYSDFTQTMATPVSIEEFLEPLYVDIDKINRLSQLFLETFEKLAAGSENQFLPTPISEAILRPEAKRKQGW